MVFKKKEAGSVQKHPLALFYAQLNVYMTLCVNGFGLLPDCVWLFLQLCSNNAPFQNEKLSVIS